MRTTILRYAANAGLIGLLAAAQAAHSRESELERLPATNWPNTAPRKTRVPMRTSFIVEARSDRARPDAEPRSTCSRKRDGAFFDLRRREFIPLLGAAAVYPSPANIREKVDLASTPRARAN
jgi:hypothetical protein